MATSVPPEDLLAVALLLTDTDAVPDAVTFTTEAVRESERSAETLEEDVGEAVETSRALWDAEALVERDGPASREPTLEPDTVWEAVTRRGVPEVVGDGNVDGDTAEVWEARGLREMEDIVDGEGEKGGDTVEVRETRGLREVEGEPLVVPLRGALREEAGEREALLVALGDEEREAGAEALTGAEAAAEVVDEGEAVEEGLPLMLAELAGEKLVFVVALEEAEAPAEPEDKAVE